MAILNIGDNLVDAMYIGDKKIDIVSDTQLPFMLMPQMILQDGILTRGDIVYVPAIFNSTDIKLYRMTAKVVSKPNEWVKMYITHFASDNISYDPSSESITISPNAEGGIFVELTLVKDGQPAYVDFPTVLTSDTVEQLSKYKWQEPEDWHLTTPVTYTLSDHNIYSFTNINNENKDELSEFVPVVFSASTPLIVTGNSAINPDGTIVEGSLKEYTSGTFNSVLGPSISLQDSNVIFKISSASRGFYKSGAGLKTTYALLAQVIGLTPDKIKAGEIILGITGTYTGE